MTWTPVVTVTIAGTDYTGDTIDLIQLRRGRNTVYTSVQPAVASITLLDKTGTGIVPTVADSVVVTLEDSGGTPVTLFVGEVSDWSTGIYDAGILNTAAAAIRVTAISNLAKLVRRQVFADGRSVEKDGERIEAIIVDALGQTWNDAQGTWNDYTTETWNTVDGAIDFSIIDSPGLYDIIALAAQTGGYNSGSIAGITGLSASGLLYETADGRIGYADGQRRATNAAAGYLALPAANLTASQLTTTSQIADLANSVVVTYGSNQQVTDEDIESIDLYTRFNQSLGTVLNDQGDAETLAELYLERHAYPFVSFESANVRLDQGLTNTLLDDLLAIEVNDAIEIDDLPATLGLSTFTGFVEGVVFNIDPYRTDLQLLVSAANLSLGPVIWQTVAGTIAWEDVDAALQWQDARSI
jgi:hypothetical protein